MPKKQVGGKIQTISIEDFLESYNEVYKKYITGYWVQAAPNKPENSKKTTILLTIQSLLQLLQKKSASDSSYKNMAIIGSDFYVPFAEIASSDRFSKIACGIIKLPILGPCLIHLGHPFNNIFVVKKGGESNFSYADNQLQLIPLDQIQKITIKIRGGCLVKKYNIDPDVFPNEFFNLEICNQASAPQLIVDFFEEIKEATQDKINSFNFGINNWAKGIMERVELPEIIKNTTANTPSWMATNSPDSPQNNKSEKKTDNIQYAGNPYLQMDYHLLSTEEPNNKSGITFG